MAMRRNDENISGREADPLRLTDADDLEEVLRARDRAKNRQKWTAFGSSKYRQKPTKSTPSAPAKQVRAIQIQANDSGSDSESDGSSGSDSDVDSHHKIFLAAKEDATPKMEKESATPDPRLPERDQGHQEHNLKIHVNRDRCSHCGSRKHSDLGCWRRVTCTKCGKRGHPSDHCLFVCRGCGELHDMGKCPMEEFYNQIRQWFNPTKHMGMLPEATEGRTRIKVTLAGSLVYFFDIWSVELPLRLMSSIHDKLWVTRGDQWVPTISGGPGRTKYISITNIRDEVLILHQDQWIGIWLAGDHVPWIPGFISICSRRYMEWQNLALEATTDTRSEEMEV
ncbi:hypothetical protein PHMEG_00025791 [Phytophthora megakarya]|uniref:CCHC-type domain-containing protein n=1 Tax=Phytophthora megakarya TaxID=4795 RepID=A0A225VCM1_9STRA|nr:hypothetical protein PHMEG_00025791 [Phytophthora megakarya]